MPVLAVPVLSEIEPDMPTLRASGEEITRDPDADDELDPLAIRMEPPAPDVDGPALMDTAPPV